MSMLLRGVCIYETRRDRVACHAVESGASEFQLCRNETRCTFVYPSSSSTGIRLSRTRGRVCRGFITEKAGHDLGKPRDIIDISRWNRIAIHPRYTRERILRFRPRIVEGKAGIMYEVERDAPVRIVLWKRKLRIELFP